MDQAKAFCVKNERRNIEAKLSEYIVGLNVRNIKIYNCLWMCIRFSLYLLRVQCICVYSSPPLSATSFLHGMDHSSLIFFILLCRPVYLVYSRSACVLCVWHVYFKRSLLFIFFAIPCQIDHTRCICLGHFYIVNGMWQNISYTHVFGTPIIIFQWKWETFQRYITTISITSSCFQMWKKKWTMCNRRQKGQWRQLQQSYVIHVSASSHIVSIFFMRLVEL